MMNNVQRKALNLFRSIALAEGISFIILLFIAMPLRKFAGIPEAVKIVGMLHGILFIAFVLSLAYAAWLNKWTFVKILLAFLSSLFPFGTFILDHYLKKDLVS